MIIIKLQGGLGNQLFQWAFGKSLSIDLKTDIVFDLSFLNQNINGITKRSFELNKFQLIEENIKESLKNINLNIITKRLNDDSQYINLDKSINYYLDGYFQKEKYFKHNNQIIQDYLQFDIKNNQYYNDIINHNSVSLHVRRTDYAKHPLHHPMQDAQYYNSALSQIKKYDHIFVFSDDTEWCKNNLLYSNITFVSGQSNIEDLILMSKCKNNIIANSSFSWWAAYLNKNENKVVIAPKNWFGPLQKNNVGMIPESWIQV